MTNQRSCARLLLLILNFQNIEKLLYLREAIPYVNFYKWREKVTIDLKKNIFGFSFLASNGQLGGDSICIEKCLQWMLQECEGFFNEN